jgi:hypothetical protein
MDEIKLYRVKTEYRGLYDNKFINNKASLPYWESSGVDLHHLDGYKAERGQVGPITKESELLQDFIHWYGKNYTHRIDLSNVEIFLKERND